MTRRIAGLDLLAAGMIGASAIASAALYDRLPDPMPTHFDLHGNPNGWMPRPWGAFLLPVMAAAIWALVRFGSRLLPEEWRKRLDRSPLAAVGALVAGLLATLHALLLQAALASPPHMGGGIWLLLGGFFVVFGLITPRVRRNPWIGVRTPWTLASDENWARTHHFAGYTMTAGGLLSMIAAAAGSPGLAVAFILVGALAPAVYSWRIAHRS
jgi:uncharacterized membrane protein